MCGIKFKLLFLGLLMASPLSSLLAQVKPQQVMSPRKIKRQNKNGQFYGASKIPAGLEVSPKAYVAMFTEDPLKIDGKLSEPAWQKAVWTDRFEDILGSSVIKGIKADKAEEILPTNVKMCWDHQYLYIGAELREPHITGSIVQKDAIIYHDNDFEVFVSPGDVTHGYFEFEMNALNTVLDLFMTKPYRDGGNALINWDAKGLMHAIAIHGTLNQPKDVDSLWTLEMAIPFAAVRLWHSKPNPEQGDIWRINFSRVQWDYAIKNGKYQHKKASNGEPLPEHNWVWSPQGVKDMHYPERWGYLYFADSHEFKPLLPVIESLKDTAWKIYYLQRLYFMKHNVYALTLSQLGISSGEIHIKTATEDKSYHLQMEATSHLYMVRILQDAGDPVLVLDQNGSLKTN